MTTLAIVALILSALSAIIAVLAGLAHAKGKDDLAAKLDVAEEALEVAGEVAQKVAGGVPPVDAVTSTEASPAAKDLIARFKVFAHLGCVLAAFSLLAGCSSPVSKADVQHLRKSITDERKATLVRAGFEAEVANLRLAEDRDLAAIESACK